MIISNFAISLVQTDDQLKISVANEETKLTKLFISPVYSEKKLQTLDPVHENEFFIDLKKLIIDLNQQKINSNKLDVQVLNEYVSASVLDDEKNLEIQPVRLNLKKADLRVENLHAYSYGTDFITPYITRNGFLAFSFNAAVPDSTYVRQETISSFSIDNESINISGNVTTNFLKVKKNIYRFLLEKY